MTKWITLIIVGLLFLLTNFAVAQTPDPFISQATSLLQTIRNLAVQLQSLRNFSLAPAQTPAHPPTTFTSTPASRPLSPPTNAIFRRSSNSYFDLVRASQAQRLSAYSSTTDTTRVKSLVPEIFSVNPTSGKIDTRVTLKGQNFTKTGNIVYTGFSQLNLSSIDGQTLTFNIARPPSMPVGFESQAESFWNENYQGVVRPGLPLGFYVKNTNGQTLKPGLFFLNF